MELTEEILQTASVRCVIPFIIQDDVATAQVTFDLSLIFTLMLSILFLPFVSYLVYLQTNNFMKNGPHSMRGRR